MTAVRDVPPPRFVYHGMPRDMVGDVLYPLNQLETIAPDVYEFQKRKYAGREAALEFRIPGLDVLFGDALHCAPIHPYDVYRARRAANIDVTIRREGSWLSGMFYAIPLERILHHQVVWYSCRTLWVNGAAAEDVPQAAPSDEFEPFDPARYQEFQEAPEAHSAYLRRMKARGQRPLMFVHIPHILVAGPIDVSGLRALAWDQPPSPRAPRGPRQAVTQVSRTRR